MSAGGTRIQRKFLDLLLYISLFPQLVAGPIVRYSKISSELDERRMDIDTFYDGLCRFVVGLAKKVLLANLFGASVDRIFSLGIENLTMPLAWSGLFLYTLQIYIDFSAYSDMAIGLGRMFGFHFDENFNLPYSAKSISEFWRRWHISLSSFLRDYLYIPLGGSRRTEGRTYFNLFVVFSFAVFGMAPRGLLWHGGCGMGALLLWIGC